MQPHQEARTRFLLPCSPPSRGISTQPAWAGPPGQKSTGGREETDTGCPSVPPGVHATGKAGETAPNPGPLTQSPISCHRTGAEQADFTKQLPGARANTPLTEDKARSSLPPRHVVFLKQGEEFWGERLSLKAPPQALRDLPIRDVPEAAPQARLPFGAGDAAQPARGSAVRGSHIPGHILIAMEPPAKRRGTRGDTGNSLNTICS